MCDRQMQSVPARADFDRIGTTIVGAAITVHRALGPGLLELIYEQCLAAELEERGLSVQRQASLPVTYRGRLMDAAYRVDLLVSKCVIVEIKAVSEMLPVHQAQLITYLKLSGCKLGYLINFNQVVIKNGIRRIVM